MTQPRKWRQLERHPLSAEYEDIGGEAYDELLADVRENGFDTARPIILHDGKVLDGWQRQRVCLEADVRPTYADLPEGTDPERYVTSVNDLRRHETEAQRQRRLATRRERVAAARRNGESIRTIAEKEGVGKATIERDLEGSTVPGGTVEPEDGTVTGRDGKKRPAKRKKKERPPLDAEGHEIPEGLREAFAVRDLFKTVDSHIKSIHKLVSEIVQQPGGIPLRMMCRTEQDEADAPVTYYMKCVRTARGEIFDRQPHSICTECAGVNFKNCKGCGGFGWMYKAEWNQRTKAEKARLKVWKEEDAE